MSTVLDKAQLVPILEGRGVAATVERAEIEEVLRTRDEGPVLVLDVVRGGVQAAEPETLRFHWDPDELEELLRETEGDAVTLMFDETALERALALSEVEAHGIRDKAVVLAVALVAAGAAPGTAAARTAPPRGAQHPAVGTGLIATPAANPAPPRGPQHPAEGTGFVPTTDAVTATAGPGVFGTDATTGAIAGGAALLVTAAGFALRGQQRRHSLRPA